MRHEFMCIIGFLFLSIGNLGAENSGALDSEKLFAPYLLRSEKEMLTLDKFYVHGGDVTLGRKAIDMDIFGSNFTPFTKKYTEDQANLKDSLYTFKTRFYVDESLRAKMLSLYIGMADAPRIAYLNGTEIFNVGRYDADLKKLNQHAYESSGVTLSRDLLHYGDVPNELSVQLYTIIHFEPLRDLVVGSQPAIAGKTFTRNLIALYLVQATFLLSVSLFLYFVFLFITRKCKEKSYLYFGLVCLFYALSNANFAFLNDSFGQYYTEMISRMAYPFAILFLSSFIMQFTGIFARSKVVQIILGIPAAFFAIATFLQQSLAAIIAMFNNTLLFYILPGLIFNAILLLVSMIRKRDGRAAVIFVGYVLVFGAAGHDMSFVMRLDTPYAYLLSLGFLALITSIFFILAYDQSKIYTKSIEQAESLNEKNKSLEGIIGNISSVTHSLSESYTRLRSVLADSSGVIRNYEESNKKITTDVASKFTDVDEILRKIAEMIAITSEKVPRAVSNQTTIVKKAAATLGEMSGYLESNISSVSASSEAAKKLSELAGRSAEIIKRSKMSISTLKDHSRFLQDVLSAIEEISEKTSILSINAAIEAARQGQNGKGFAIIANEIRGLSNQSKSTVTESLDKVKAMFGIVDESTLLSDEVEKSLSIIFRKIGDTSIMIGRITDLIENQRKNASQTASEVENLLRDTLMIESLTLEEQAENEKIQVSLADFKNTFLSIGDALREQSEKGAELVKYIGIIQEITSQNFEHVTTLKSSIA